MKNFDDIYQSNYQALYQYVSRVMPNNLHVQDIVQETFVKLYLQTGASVEIEYPKTWLFKVASNECLNRLSRNHGGQALETIGELPDDVDENIDRKLATADKEQAVHKALDMLKPSDRSLLVLYSEGFSYKEIAEIGQVNFNSVGKTLARALEKLEQILKKHGYEMFDE